MFCVVGYAIGWICGQYRTCDRFRINWAIGWILGQCGTCDRFWINWGPSSILCLELEMPGRNKLCNGCHPAVSEVLKVMVKPYIMYSLLIITPDIVSNIYLCRCSQLPVFLSLGWNIEWGVGFVLDYLHTGHISQVNRLFRFLENDHKINVKSVGTYTAYKQFIVALTSS